MEEHKIKEFEEWLEEAERAENTIDNYLFVKNTVIIHLEHFGMESFLQMVLESAR